ncbi:MAG: flagellar biosynthesis anti-sigma factor FlgM [Nitrospirae bacterium]|nr:flagellar biosynthesis anti-sigma factor FlgM [Nitrospirota bacterium]MBF0591025.1 flagellar biosynthesis anti-sigma factor FlgM [Nitrospirota bacterium]
MKIYGTKPIEGKESVSPVKKIDRADSNTSGSSISNTDRVATSDRVNLSSKAKDFEELKGKIDQLPEQRTDKIKVLKESVDNGTYSIDSKAIATKMLQEVL